ncbi:MAG: hypothetical protein FWJ65_12120 [Limnochordales bacterium]
MTQHDNRLVLVICGDDATSYLHYWLDSPCDEHDHHTVSNRLPMAPGFSQASVHQWLMDALEYAAKNVCLCGAEEAPSDAVTTILEATRG